MKCPRTQQDCFNPECGKTTGICEFPYQTTIQTPSERGQDGWISVEDYNKALQSIYEMLVLEIPYYAYGDNEAACQMADQINHAREFIVHELTLPNPPPKNSNA